MQGGGSQCHRRGHIDAVAALRQAQPVCRVGRGAGSARGGEGAKCWADLSSLTDMPPMSSARHTTRGDYGHSMIMDTHCITTRGDSGHSMIMDTHCIKIRGDSGHLVLG